MMTTKEIISHLNNGGYFLNESADYQFIKRSDGVMLEYSGGNYKFYSDIQKFAKRISFKIKRG